MDIPLDSVEVLRDDVKRSKMETLYLTLCIWGAWCLLYRSAFDNALSAFNAKIEFDLFGNSSELGVPLFSIPKPCSACLRVFAADIYRDHVVSCAGIVDEVLKLKKFKKDALLKLFKLSNQEKYEHVSPKVTSTQGGKDYKMTKRDYAWLMISSMLLSYSGGRMDSSVASNSTPVWLRQPRQTSHGSRFALDLDFLRSRMGEDTSSKSYKTFDAKDLTLRL
nr:hypothetical protein [Tanacetum cinerariifolium]